MKIGPVAILSLSSHQRKKTFGMTQTVPIAFCIAIYAIAVAFHSVSAQRRIYIDVITDIPSDGAWEVDCQNGYTDFPIYFDCEGFGGAVNITPGDLNGEIGFWTKCDYVCQLRYRVQPDDFSFKARVYQSNMPTEISFDGIVWDFIEGEGWVEIDQILDSFSHPEIIIRLDHFSENYFNTLDKIVINGDFDPPVTQEPTELTTTCPEIPTTPEPEPCTCCARCPQREIKEIHHHHHHYHSEDKHTPSMSPSKDDPNDIPRLPL